MKSLFAWSPSTFSRHPLTSCFTRKSTIKSYLCFLFWQVVPMGMSDFWVLFGYRFVTCFASYINNKLLNTLLKPGEKHSLVTFRDIFDPYWKKASNYCIRSTCIKTRFRMLRSITYNSFITGRKITFLERQCQPPLRSLQENVRTGRDEHVLQLHR